MKKLKTKSCLKFLKDLFNVSVIALLAVMLSGVPSLAVERVYFYHNDATGTPVAMTDDTGAVVWQMDYLPFGEERQKIGVYDNDHRFTGKILDEETDLYYFNARYMDSRLGRFIKPDPVRAVNPFTGAINTKMLKNPQRLNLYSYGLNNPYRFIDPDGREVPLDFDTDVSTVDYSFFDFVNHTIIMPVSLIMTAGALHGAYATGGTVALAKEVAKEVVAEVTGISSVDKVLAKSVAGKVGKTKQFKKSGSINQANKDFDSIAGSSFKDHGGGVRSTKLKDGTTVSVRPSSSGGKPTLQINKPKSKTIKVRYE